MKIAIVQPNFFPFKAYYDLASKVDKFVFLDDTPYTSKSWVNKCLFKLKGKNYYFRIPLKESPDNSTIITNTLKIKNENWKNKFLKVIKAEYKKAPNYDLVVPLLQEIINIPTENFAHTSAYSIFRISHSILGSEAKFSFSSTNYSNVKISYQDKMIHICEKENANTLYTLSRNRGVFNEKKFNRKNISISYFASYGNNYSIIDDLMMNHSYRDILIKECNLL